MPLVKSLFLRIIILFPIFIHYITPSDNTNVRNYNF
jgi:hypothetical protein